MMKQPVEQRSGKDLVPQEAAPLGKAGVGGQQDRAVLIASGNQLEEVVCLSRRKFRVSNLVNHEHTWGGVATKPLANQTGIGSGIQRLSQMREGRKQGGIPCAQGFHRECQTQVRFSPSIRMPS